MDIDRKRINRKCIEVLIEVDLDRPDVALAAVETLRRILLELCETDAVLKNLRISRN